MLKVTDIYGRTFVWRLGCEPVTFGERVSKIKADGMEVSALQRVNPYPKVGTQVSFDGGKAKVLAVLVGAAK